MSVLTVLLGRRLSNREVGSAKAGQLPAALMRDAGPRLVVVNVLWRIMEE